MSKHLTDPERLALLQEYLSGSHSKHAFCKLHDLDLKAVSRWLNRFGLEDKPSPRTMKKNKEPIPHSSQSELEAELNRLKKENLQLRNRLRYEALGHEAYKRLALGLPKRPTAFQYEKTPKPSSRGLGRAATRYQCALRPTWL